MTYEEELRSLWRQFDDVAIELAHVRDSYVSLPGEERKFNRLAHAYGHLRNVEEALYNYIQKDRRANEGADHLALVMSRAALDYAKSETDWAHDDLQPADGEPDA